MNKRPPLDSSEMSPIEKMFVQSVMFEHGIVPIENIRFDVSRALAATSPEEARILRRKFRKMWRKLARESKTNQLKFGRGRTDAEQKLIQSQIDKRLGVGKRTPTKQERTERKRLVFNEVWNNEVCPMISKFETIERKKKSDDVA